MSATLPACRIWIVKLKVGSLYARVHDSTLNREEGKRAKKRAKSNFINRFYLLAKHYTQTAAPAFGEADADDFHIAREIALEDVRGGMKAQGRGDEIDERRGGVEFESGEIAIAGE